MYFIFYKVIEGVIKTVNSNKKNQKKTPATPVPINSI